MAKPRFLIAFTLLFFALTALFISCFSPWAGDEAIISLNFSEMAESRSILYQSEFNEIEHTVALRGPNGPLPLITIPKGQSSFRISVDRGRWEITVEASQQGGTLFAQGSAVAEIRPGLNRVRILMDTLLYIRVSSRDDLMKIGHPAWPDWPLNGNYRMGGNIDIGGINWKPIGEGTPFVGTFDGRGYTISGLTITNWGANSGLFGVVGTSGSSGGLVRNVRLTGVSIVDTSTANNHGGIAGTNNGTIEYCSVYGTADGGGITANNTLGGLVGLNTSTGIIRNSYANIQIYSTATVDAHVGGLVGHSNGGNISESYASGNVSGEGNNIGGLVGHSNGGFLIDCYATGNVEGLGNVGGLVGRNASTTVNGYARGNVSGNTTAGGVVGAHASGGVTGFAALNQIVEAAALGTNAGRVIGNNTGGGGTQSNNYALETMNITINNATKGTIIVGSESNDGDHFSLPGAPPNSLPNDAAQWNLIFHVPLLNTEWDFTNTWIWNSALGRPVLRNVGPGANRAPIPH